MRVAPKVRPLTWHAFGVTRGDEDLRCPDFAGLRADYINSVARIIDKQTLARGMPPLGRFALQIACRAMVAASPVTNGLPTRCPTGDLAQPNLPRGGVERAISAVPIAVWVDGAILFPEQSQGHTLPAQRAVDIGPVGLGDVAARCARFMWIKPMLKRSVRQVIRQRPGQTRHISPPEILRHRCPPKRQALRHTTP